MRPVPAQDLRAIAPGDFDRDGRPDIVVGEVGRPFERPAQIRSWTMLSPRDRPLALDAVRRGNRRVVRVTLTAHPGR